MDKVTSAKRTSDTHPETECQSSRPSLWHSLLSKQPLTKNIFSRSVSGAFSFLPSPTGRASPSLLKCSLHRFTQFHWCWVSDMTGPCPPTGVLRSVDGKGMVTALSALVEEAKVEEEEDRHSSAPERQANARSA